MSTPDVEFNIQITDETVAEVIRWRGMKDTGTRDGYLEFEVFSRKVEIVGGRQTSSTGARLMSGTAKADGCFAFAFDPVHWCLLVEFQRHMQVLGNLYVRAWDLLGALPPADDPHGRDTYAKAVVARELRGGARPGTALRVVGSDP